MVSDLLLFFITVNVLVSGIVDWSRGGTHGGAAPQSPSIGGTSTPGYSSSFSWRCTSGIGGSASGGRRFDGGTRPQVSPKNDETLKSGGLSLSFPRDGPVD